MGLGSFPSCRLVTLPLKGQMTPKQMIVWNPEVKNFLKRFFILSTLNFFFFLHSTVQFPFFFFFLSFCENLLLLQSLLQFAMMAVAWCQPGTQPDLLWDKTGGNSWQLQVSAKQRRATLLPAVSVWQNAILGYTYSREWIKKMWDFVCLF